MQSVSHAAACAMAVQCHVHGNTSICPAAAQRGRQRHDDIHGTCRHLFAVQGHQTHGSLQAAHAPHSQASAALPRAPQCAHRKRCNARRGPAIFHGMPHALMRRVRCRDRQRHPPRRPLAWALPAALHAGSRKRRLHMCRHRCQGNFACSLPAEPRWAAYLRATMWFLLMISVMVKA